MKNTYTKELGKRLATVRQQQKHAISVFVKGRYINEF